MNKYAPIILFVYNRPEHTRRTIEALQYNELAADSLLYIRADGPKENATEKQRAKIQQVRDCIASINGFREIHIEASDVNKGLAKSIVSGVTEIVNKYGKVIVLEDDIVTSPYFLKYMNQSLDLYENDEKVVCINGYSIIKDAPIKENTYFQYGADCWGWATWKRGWEIYNPDAVALMDTMKRNRKVRRLFTYDGSYPYMEMLQNQIDGVIDSWAVRWYASAVINGRLCLYPAKSLVQNIGFGEGTHCSASDVYEASILADDSVSDFPKIATEDSDVMRNEWKHLFRKIHKEPLRSKIAKWKRRIKRSIKRRLR